VLCNRVINLIAASCVDLPGMKPLWWVGNISARSGRILCDITSVKFVVATDEGDGSVGLCCHGVLTWFEDWADDCVCP